MHAASVLGSIIGGLVPISIAFFLCRAVAVRWFLPAQANVLAGLGAFLACGSVALYIANLNDWGPDDTRAQELWFAYLVDAALVVTVRTLLDNRRADRERADADLAARETVARPPAAESIAPGPVHRRAAFPWPSGVAIALSLLALLRSCDGVDEDDLRADIAHAQNEGDIARRRVEELEARVQLLEAQVAEHLDRHPSGRRR